MALDTSPVIAGQIGSDTQQPGTKRRATTIRGNGAKSSNEGVLRHISRHIWISKHTKDNAIHRLLVAQHQQIKGVDVASLTTDNELFLILPCGLTHMLADLFCYLGQCSIFWQSRLLRVSLFCVLEVREMPCIMACI